MDRLCINSIAKLPYLKNFYCEYATCWLTRSILGPKTRGTRPLIAFQLKLKPYNPTFNEQDQVKEILKMIVLQTISYFYLNNSSFQLYKKAQLKQLWKLKIIKKYLLSLVTINRKEINLLSQIVRFIYCKSLPGNLFIIST